MKRSGRVLLLAHCVLNQNAAVQPLARSAGVHRRGELVQLQPLARLQPAVHERLAQLRVDTSTQAVAHDGTERLTAHATPRTAPRRPIQWAASSTTTDNAVRSVATAARTGERS